jgi:hypothetical protein
MSRLPAGTPSSVPCLSHYTNEQLATLETLKDPGYVLGIARAECANTILCPDGSRSTDIESMRAAAQERVASLIAEGTSESLAAAARAAETLREIDSELAQHRFLFIVDADFSPVVYFQCAVAHNPDLPAQIAIAPDVSSDSAEEQ